MLAEIRECLFGLGRPLGAVRRGEFMRPHWKSILCGALIGVASFLMAAGRNAPAEQSVQPTVLPNGWKVTPAGTLVPLAGDMPLRVLPLPDGRRVLILTGGYHDHSLSLVDIASGKVLQNLELGKVWAGLAADANFSTLYVSGGCCIPSGRPVG